MMAKASPLSISFLVHGFFVASFLILQLNFKSLFSSEKIPIEVIDIAKPVAANLNLQLSKSRAEEKPPAPQPQRKVFGVSRKALTTTETTAHTAEIKQGNTVAKENDNLKLNENDADSIPIPADDYLVTSQVALIKDVKIPYPAEARKKNIEGSVVMDIIIDQQGRVRDANLVRGPGFGLNEAAMAVIKDFLFRPARVGEQAVAVKIRYSYRFVLENK